MKRRSSDCPSGISAITASEEIVCMLTPKQWKCVSGTQIADSVEEARLSRDHSTLHRRILRGLPISGVCPDPPPMIPVHDRSRRASWSISPLGAVSCHQRSTTAVLAVDQLHRLLRLAGKRNLHNEYNIRRTWSAARDPPDAELGRLRGSRFHRIRTMARETFRSHGDCERWAKLVQSLPEHRHAPCARRWGLLDRALGRSTFSRRIWRLPVSRFAGLRRRLGRAGPIRALTSRRAASVGGPDFELDSSDAPVYTLISREWVRLDADQHIVAAGLILALSAWWRSCCSLRRSCLRRVRQPAATPRRVGRGHALVGLVKRSFRAHCRHSVWLLL